MPLNNKTCDKLHVTSDIKSNVKGQLSNVRKSKGFTLIELLVVIAIIGVLAAFAFASFGGAQARARDAQRKNDLKVIQKTLQLYYQDHNAYPIATGWESSEVGDAAANNAASWIYDQPTGTPLVPNYIKKLPTDPKSGQGDPNLTPGCSSWKRSYLYLSLTGKGYTVLAHCSVEEPWNSTNGFYDCARPTLAWKVYELDGGAGESACGY